MKGGRVPIHIMRWAPADYVNDPFVRLLIAEEDFATLAFYHLVLNWSHIEGGDLSADPRQLAASLGMRRHRVVRSLQVCVEAGKLEVVEGRLYHPRVVREVQAELAYRIEQAELGRKGGKVAGRGRPKQPIGDPLIEDRATPLETDRPAVRRAPAPAPDASRGNGDRPANPLLTGRRPEMEREGYRLIREIGVLEPDRDPTEILLEAARWEGKDGRARTKCRLETMTDDHLIRTVHDLRTILEAAKEERGAKARAVQRQT